MALQQCPVCGRHNAQGAAWCVDCRTPFDGQAKPVQATPLERRGAPVSPRGAPSAVPVVPPAPIPAYRKVSLLLGIGIFFSPYLFGWLLLRPGYSLVARVVTFAWMLVVLISAAFSTSSVLGDKETFSREFRNEINMFVAPAHLAGVSECFYHELKPYAEERGRAYDPKTSRSDAAATVKAFATCVEAAGSIAEVLAPLKKGFTGECVAASVNMVGQARSTKLCSCAADEYFESVGTSEDLFRNALNLQSKAEAAAFDEKVSQYFAGCAERASIR